MLWDFVLERTSISSDSCQFLYLCLLFLPLTSAHPILSLLNVGKLVQWQLFSQGFTHLISPVPSPSSTANGIIQRVAHLLAQSGRIPWRVSGNLK